MSQRNYYQVLGVSPRASVAEIRAAYVRLSKRHHPDVAGELQSRFPEIQQAYRCLSDANARAAHDRTIAESERLHLARQARIQRRLHGYDRRHPHPMPKPPRRWNWRPIVLLGTGVAVAARLSWRLFW